ncbi:MAG: NAD(P)H-quinone oxidoreductase [Actinomycetota bacterium]
MLAVTFADGSLTVAERPVPEATDGHVVVRVHGAGLNRADLIQRAGLYPAPPGVPADIPGLEFAGVVSACGADVDGVQTGDRVFAVAGGGAQAEYVRVPAAHCVVVPSGLELVAMGAVPEAFVTAHDAMVTQGRVAWDEWVLVHAAGSGVGTAAVQLAHALGARVIGTARTESKLARCRPLGLDHGIVAPATDDGALHVAALAFAIIDATGGGADVTLDLTGGPYVEVDVAAAAPRGRIVLIGTLAGGRAQLEILSAMGKRLQINGTVLRSRSDEEKAVATAAFARDVVPLLERGTIAPVVDAVVPLAKAADAYDLLASDTTFGKIVLDCRATS